MLLRRETLEGQTEGCVSSLKDRVPPRLSFDAAAPADLLGAL
jgi:hypothetical protein